MLKQRFNLIASSMANYFGVGFKTPEEQLAIDLGEIENAFDDEAKRRMEQGNILENASLDLLEHVLGIKIDERNNEYKYAVDGLLKCKRDGRTFIDGEEIGVENKVSNASQNFTSSLTYYIQCQCYMMAWGLDKWLLGGLYKGEVVYKIIKRDEEMIKDIETMVKAVFNILNGVLDKSDFPYDIVSKYTTTPNNTIDNIKEDDKILIKKAIELDKKIKEDTKELDTIKEYLKENYDNGKIALENGSTISIYETKPRVTFDKELFEIENPKIDLSKYDKIGSASKAIRINAK